MAGNIKGISIVFDAKTTALETALNKVKGAARKVQSDLNAVNRTLRFNPKNTELIAQKQTLLKQKVEQSKQALEKYKNIQSQLDAKNIDKQSSAYMRVRREIIAAKSQIKATNAEIARMKWAPMKNFGNAAQSAGQKLTTATRGVRMLAGALAGLALYKGFQRLKSLDETSKQLEVLGYKGEKLDKIMGDVSGSVDGTRFMLQDMAKVASGALGSGVTDKYELGDYLKKTADLAQLAGIDVQSMGAMMNKAFSKGKVDAKIMNQLNSHGIPIYKLMQKELGVTADELAEMSKKGKLSFDDLYKATDRYNGLAQKMGTETLPGALTVLGQQFGLIGADFLSGVYEPLKTGVQGIVKSIKQLRADGTFKAWGEDIGNVVKYFVQYFSEGSASMDGLSDRAQNLITALSPIVNTIGTVVQTLAKLPPELQGLVGFMTLFGGPLLTGLGTAVVNFANLATNVQTFAMNAAAGVGPTSMLTSGTTSLGSAAGLLINPFTLAAAAVGAWALAIKNANDKLHESTTAFEEWKAGNQEGINAAKASGAEVDLYKQKLMSLMEKEKKSAGDKALIKTYVDKLNGAIDGLNLKYDVEKDKLNKTSKAIENKIEKYKKAALVKAYEDLITEAAKKEAEEQMKLSDLYEERKEVQDRWNNSAEHSALLETQYKQSMSEVNAKIKDSKKAISGYQQEMDKAGNAVTGLKNKSKKGFQEAATSAKTEGKKTPKNYGAGVTAGAGAATKAASKVAEGAAKKLDVDTSGEGRDFGNGFANGIASTARSIADKAASIVKKAIAAAKKAQDSGSPSKIMRGVGRDYGTGYALGINDEFQTVQSSANRLISGAIGSATRPLGGMALAGSSSTANTTMYVNASINVPEGTDGRTFADEFTQELELRARSRNEVI